MANKTMDHKVVVKSVEEKERASSLIEGENVEVEIVKMQMVVVVELYIEGQIVVQSLIELELT